MYTTSSKIFLGAAVLLGLFVGSASAAPITAVELIQDQPPFEFFDRNLTRTLTDSNGFNSVITNDASIIASNQVDDDFGVYNLSTVTYRHNLTWLNPAASSYLNATLTILAYGPDNNNDSVIVESLNIGNLVSDGMILDGFTTSIFSSSTPSLLNALFADGYLYVTITKGPFLGFIPDPLSVYSSKLEVTYNGADVPEPATMLLLGSGLVGFAARRRVIA